MMRVPFIIMCVSCGSVGDVHGGFFLNGRAQHSAYFIDIEEKYSRLTRKKTTSVFTSTR
jgi:hypothetical protein